jgi:hypothetical protein
MSAFRVETAVQFQHGRFQVNKSTGEGPLQVCGIVPGPASQIEQRDRMPQVWKNTMACYKVSLFA